MGPVTEDLARHTTVSYGRMMPGLIGTLAALGPRVKSNFYDVTVTFFDVSIRTWARSSCRTIGLAT